MDSEQETGSGSGGSERKRRFYSSELSWIRTAGPVLSSPERSCLPGSEGLPGPAHLPHQVVGVGGGAGVGGA